MDLINTLTPSPKLIRDDTVHLSQHHYNDAIEEYLSLLPADGVKLVAQFGSVTTPGASDLDLLVVTNNSVYPEIKSVSKKIVDQIEHGTYLFWHPPAILPKKAIDSATVLHTFDDLRPLRGEMSVIPQRTLSESGSILRTVVWNSFVWRTLIASSYGVQSLRKLLLVLSNVAQSIKASCSLMDRDFGEHVAQWVKNDVRKAIMEAPSDDKINITVDTLQLLLRMWIQIEQRLQTQLETRFELPRATFSRLVINPPVTGAYIRFGNSHIDHGVGYVGDKLLSLFHNRQLKLPYFYSQILSGIITLFGNKTNDSLQETDALKTGLDTYRNAVQDILSIDNTFEDTDSLFDDVFITPFGLSPNRGLWGREMIYGRLV